MNLDGKTAIVAGGGRDIGRACVMRLARAGANVGINYLRSTDGAESAVREIEAAGGRAFAMQGDMTRPDEARAFHRHLLGEIVAMESSRNDQEIERMIVGEHDHRAAGRDA